MSRITAPALLVGSVPLASAEEVLRASAAELGDLLQTFPDGEVGDRINWVFYLAVRTYRGHPDLETVYDGQGEEITQPPSGASIEQRAKSAITFRVRPGVDAVTFDDLHYAAPAIESYRVFARLREAGEIPRGARFQVALPASGSAINSFFADAGQWSMVIGAYRAAIGREIAKMLAEIPAADLAIQYDVAAEVRDLYLGDERALPWAPERSADEKWAWHLADIAPLAAAVPDDVVLGYHLCFGTWGGWPHTPGLHDLGICVRLANEIVARAGREVDYVHMPVLPDCDESFLAPLADLRPAGTRVYTGIAYHDGAEGARRRIDLLRNHLDDFGVAWYCGFGRLPADEVAPILRHVRTCAEQLLSVQPAR
jgi:hypothetical protein